MRVIKADVEACKGYANCVVAAADIFDIGDDGTVVILDDSVTERDETADCHRDSQLPGFGSAPRNAVSESVVNSGCITESKRIDAWWC